MLPPHLLTHEVCIVKPGKRADRYAQAVDDWSPKAVSRTYTRGFLGQNVGRDAENLDGRDAQVSGYQLFLPANTDITGHDRVEIDGASFEVVGPPLVRRVPSGAHHIEARLRAVSG